MSDSNITVVCRSCGAHSTTTDFCSDCGGKLTQDPPQDPPTSNDVVVSDEFKPMFNADGKEICPVCNEERSNQHAMFCDNCRFNFNTRQPFIGTQNVQTDDVLTPPPLAQDTDLTIVKPTEAPKAFLKNYDLVVMVNREKVGAGDHPKDPDQRIFPMDFKEIIIGRGVAVAGAINPDIVVQDPGVSRGKHARIDQGNNDLTVIDLSSANGTVLNGVELTPNVPTSLKTGDILDIGCWTRIIIKAK
jgi:hypothetical protein